MRRVQMRRGITLGLAIGTLCLAPVSPAVGQDQPTTPAPWPTSGLDGAIAIAAGPGGVVAVGGSSDQGSLAGSWISSDGVTWTESPAAAALRRATMTVVTATTDGYVALGNRVDETGARGDRIVAWASSDGVTWERREVQRARFQGFEAAAQEVVAGPAGLLAYGTFFGQGMGRQRLWRSADGSTWETTPLPEANVVFTSLTAYPAGYLLTAVPGPGGGDPSALMWRSADGITWEAVAGPTDGRPVDLAANDAGTIVGVGGRTVEERGQAIWTTSDLEEWQLAWQSPNPDSLEDEEALNWVGSDGHRFFATGAVIYGSQPCVDGVGQCALQPILVSSDGITWAESNGPDGEPGPDPETNLADVAPLGVGTVGLGSDASGTAAWLISAASEGEAAP
jgi:hypothetical protein